MPNYDLGTASGKIEIDYNDNGAATKASQDLDTVSKKGKFASDVMKGASTKMLMAGGVIAGGLALASKTAADFEKGISAIGAVSGATGPQLEQIRKKALQLGKDTAFSASESAQAMEELVKAGLSVDDVLNGAADATVALAAAGGVDMPTAAQISSNAMNQFGLAAKDMVGVVDTIAGAANASAIDVTEFGMSLSQVGAVAHLAGVDFDDTATAIALMGNAGIKGSDAGTSLKSMLSRLQPTTKKQLELFKQLGLETADGSNKFYDASGKLKSLSDVSGVLQKSLKGMTQQQKQATLQTLFGADAIRAAAVLSGQGSKGFDKMAKSMHKVSAEDVAKQRMDNFAGSLEQLKGSLETAAIAIGTVLIPTLRSIVNFITGVFNKFLDLNDGVKAFVTWAAVGVSALLLLAGGFIKAWFAVQNMITGMKTIAAAIKGWTIWTKIASAATKVWSAVQAVFNAVMSANPVVLIVIAIVALIAVLVLAYKKVDWFRNFVDAAWRAIWNVIKGVVGWIVDVVKTAWTWIATATKTYFMLIKTVITTYVKIWYTVIKAVITAIVAVVRVGIRILWPIVKAVFSKIVAGTKLAWRIISTAIKVAIAVIKAVVQTGVAFVKAVFDRIKEIIAVVRAVFAAIVGAIRDKINAAMDVVRSIKDRISGFFSGAASWLFNAGKNIIQGLIDGIKNMIGSVVDTIQSITDKLPDWFPGSPAKKGALSKHGGYEMRHRGEAMVRQLNDGIKRGQKSTEDTVRELTKGIARATWPKNWKRRKTIQGEIADFFDSKKYRRMSKKQKKEIQRIAKRDLNSRFGYGMNSRKFMGDLAAVMNIDVHRSKHDKNGDGGATHGGKRKRQRSAAAHARSNGVNITVQPAPVHVKAPQIHINNYAPTGDRAIGKATRRLRDLVDNGVMR